MGSNQRVGWADEGWGGVMVSHSLHLKEIMLETVLIDVKKKKK
jgi:hypothetical protein